LQVLEGCSHPHIIKTRIAIIVIPTHNELFAFRDRQGTFSGRSETKGILARTGNQAHILKSDRSAIFDYVPIVRQKHGLPENKQNLLVRGTAHAFTNRFSKESGKFYSSFQHDLAP